MIYMNSHRNLMVGLLVLSITGCGLSDYQSRIDSQRARLKKFDDANQLLGDPVDIPMVPIPGKGAESVPAWPFDFFLRLPKGYVQQKTPVYTNSPVYRYAGPDPDYNVFVAAALLVDKDAKERYGEYTSRNFRDLMRFAIDDYYFKDKSKKVDYGFFSKKLKDFLPENTKYDLVESDLITPFSDVVIKIPYFTTSFDDKKNSKQEKKTEFRVYLYEQAITSIEEGGKTKKVPGRQVAIVTQSPIGGPNEQFDRSIQAALGTLDPSAEVVTKRAQYKRLKGS